MKKRKELSVEEKKGNENNLRKGKSPNRSPSNSSNKKSEPDPNQIKIDTFFMTSKDPKPSPKALKSPDKDKELKKSETVIIHSDSELSYYRYTYFQFS